MRNLIFNKNDNGGEEIHRLVGILDADLVFAKWEPYLKLSVRQITAIVGNDVFQAASNYYNNGIINGIQNNDNLLDTFLEKVQTCNVFFAWIKIIPTLDAQHGNAGRQKRNAENERGLTAVEQYKDEANIQAMAYESIDDLLAFLDENKDLLPFWTNSEMYKSIQQLIIPDLRTFNAYYRIASFRLFYSIWPWIKEVQEDDIIPIITTKRYADFKAALAKPSADRDDYDLKLLDLQNAIYRPTVLLSMIKTFKRLPVQAIPEGLVQVQIIGTVKERTEATETAIQNLISSLLKDADSAILNLQNLIAQLDGEGEAYVSKARSIGNGFTF